MSSISSLPPELLSLILLETQAEARAYNTPTHEKHFSFLPNAIHWLRLTNRSFNSIILCTPELWSFIAITEDVPTLKQPHVMFHQWERHISRCIERSGIRPLDVTFAYAHCEILRIACSLLSPHTGRLRSLRFLTGPTLLTYLRPSYELLQPFFVNHALPRLETLTVVGWTTGSRDISDPLIVDNAPNVQHLTITGGWIHKVHFSSPNTPKLHSLRLTRWNKDIPSLAELVDSSKNTLEYLDIELHAHRFSVVKGLSRISLPALHTLRLNKTPGWNLLTKYIHTPNLRSLTLSMPPRRGPRVGILNENGKPLEPMLHLQSLEWLSVATGTSSLHGSFEAILVACPNLQRLSVVVRGIPDSLSSYGPLTGELRILAAEEGGGVKFCAGLKVLRVSCPSSELLDEVKRLRAGVLEVVQSGYRQTY
ncbi:hypothetical protein FRB99_000128 [Tulasnella sp. 403]|nr:hypothetical protein FRB99_000128 [Tulasnella sp. 403]